MRFCRIISIVAALLVGGAGLCIGQGIAHYPTPEQPAGTPRLQFDIISVKPAPPDQRSGGVQPTPGYEGYICDNASLFTDMTVAYGVTGRQIEGGPDWIRSQPWDIEAKSDRPHSIDELHLMLEHALEGRFSLKLHHETRQESVLALEVDPHGAKLKLHEPENDTNTPPIGIGPGSQPNTLALSGTNVSMTYLAFMLTRLGSTPVLDRTGLDGHYDFSVEFPTPPRPENGAAPGPPDFTPLFDAMRDQLGLQLRRGGKGPVDHLVIDSVQKPTAN
ncbi:MAG TPA: TIGR03435 family protein [Terriglobales bacterium]|nr:TIGR03435 family protein [Terriglobales bacterium]